jgi:hypothetical protein
MQTATLWGQFRPFVLIRAFEEVTSDVDSHTSALVDVASLGVLNGKQIM